MKRYDDIVKFKAGERYCESNAYGTIWFVVKDDAVETVDDEHTQVRFTGITDSGEEINFLVTKGFEHYGPRIYSMPAYISASEAYEQLNQTPGE